MRKYLLANPDEHSLKIFQTIVRKSDPEAKVISAFGNNEIEKSILTEKPEFILLCNDLSTSGTGVVDLVTETRKQHCPDAQLVLLTEASATTNFQEEELDPGFTAVFTRPLNELSLRIHLKNWLTKNNGEPAPDNTAERKNKYRVMFEKSPDGIMVINNQGQVLEANEAIATITGINAEKIVGKSLSDFFKQLNAKPSKSIEFKEEQLKQILTHPGSSLFGKPQVEEITRPDHKVRFIESVFYRLHGYESRLITCVVRDITHRKLFDEAVKTSELKYHRIFEDNKDGISIFFLNTDNTVSNFIEANKAAYELVGYSKEEFLSMNIFDFELPQKDEFFINALNQLKRNGFFNAETTLRKQTGEQIIVDLNIQTINYNNRLAIMVIVRDITARKQAEKALKESEIRFKMLFEKAPVAYQSLDKNGNLVDVNETWLLMMGYQKEEAIGRWFGSFVTPEYLEPFVEHCNNVPNEQQVQAELELYNKNRKIIRVQIRGFAGHLPNEPESYLHCVLSDITELHAASKAIAEEQILLRTLIDNIPDMIFVKDILGRKLISNKADLALLGLSDESKVCGKTDLELFDGDMAWQMYHDDLTVISTGKPIVNKHLTLVGPDGVKRVISSTKIPLTGESGEIIGLVGVNRDITGEKLSAQKITQLSKGIEQSPSSIIITDITGNIEYANPKVEQITGYSSKEILGKNPRIFQSGFTSAEEYKKLWKTIKNGREYHGEIQNRKKNGEIYWESILISPLRNEEGRIINYIGIKEDITARKKYELELRKLTIAIEQSPASVIITDTQGTIEYVNKKFISTTGYLAEELIGKIVRILKPGHLEENLFEELRNCLNSGKEWRGEHLNRTKSKVYYWESVLISPVKNQEGKVTNYIILSEDISERKKMEHDLIQAKEKAEESDRLKSAFLANMSHEIRTPLNSILGFSDLLADPDLDNKTRLDYAGLINTSGTNLLAIINDVLDISKIEAGQITLSKSYFEASELLTEIKKEYTHKARIKGVELRLSSPENAGEIMLNSDRIRVKQILVNFVGNALKFTDSGYIEIGHTLSGNEIRFYVKDTGIGIPKEYHEKIFERFRQIEGAHTRRYSGNGLGLAITKNLAELLGGRVWLESEPGLGSTFFFAIAVTD